MCSCTYTQAIVAKHMTSVLFSVQFDNFDRTMGFYWSYMLLLKPPVLSALATHHVKIKNQISPATCNHNATVYKSPQHS